MKRLLTLLLSLSLGLSVCMPVHAQFSFQEDSTIDTSAAAADGTETDTVDEQEEDGGTSRESAGSYIGDSASYYNIEDLEDAPDVVAESAILMDAASGAVLYGKEEDTRQYPASITKIMTALLAIENCSMDDIVTFSSEAVNGIEAGSSSAGINAGAELTVEDTLYALMLVSANEAAAALAEHISGSDEEFAKLMTKRAGELGCTDTNFRNPHGLPDEEHYTTAHDMALILREAMKHEEFRTIAEADTYTLQKSDTLTDTLELWNHAKIIRDNSEYYYEYAEGSKPGYTMAAKNTLATYAKKDNVELICVVLKDDGADNSYYDTTNLFEWGFDNVKAIEPLSSFNLNSALKTNKNVTDSKLTDIKRLGCTYPRDYSVLVRKDFNPSDIKTSFVLDEDIHEGRIGYINITSGGNVIGTAQVTYDTSTDAAQSYVSSGSVDDDLETAPVDEDRLTPGKLFNYLIRAVVIVIILALIVSFIRRRQAEKRRQQRIRARKKQHASSYTRGGVSGTSGGARSTGRTGSRRTSSRTRTGTQGSSSRTRTGGQRATGDTRTTGSRTSGTSAGSRSTGRRSTSQSRRTHKRK